MVNEFIASIKPSTHRLYIKIYLYLLFNIYGFLYRSHYIVCMIHVDIYAIRFQAFTFRICMEQLTPNKRRYDIYIFMSSMFDSSATVLLFPRKGEMAVIMV